jgi:hypothetical protein
MIFYAVSCSALEDVDPMSRGNKTQFIWLGFGQGFND